MIGYLPQSRVGMQRPEKVILVTEILGYVVAATSAICSSVVVYIAYKHSPREMGAYKWYVCFRLRFGYWSFTVDVADRVMQTTTRAGTERKVD